MSVALLRNSSRLLRRSGVRMVAIFDVHQGLGAGSHTMIRAQIKAFEGNVYIDLRKYFKPEDDPSVQDFLPTRKGITMNVDQFEAFVSSVERIRREIQTQRVAANTAPPPEVSE